jgi:hypothetical protein
MSRTQLLIVEPTLISTRATIEAARSLAFEPVLLCDRRHYGGDAASALALCEVHDLDASDAAAMQAWAEAHRGADVAGVYTPADRYLAPASTLAHALGVPGPDPAVTLLGDKARVGELVPEFSPPHLEFDPEAPPMPALEALARAQGGLVFKPTRLAGARGVFEMSEFNEAEIRAGLARERASVGASQPWMAQVRVKGALASLEGLFTDGRLVVLGHSLRRKIGKAECINTFPAAAHLALAVRERMQQAVTALAQRSGFRQGLCHAEFIVEEAQCHLIDANFGRLAGSGLGIQIGWSYGLTPCEVYAAAIDECVLGGRLLRGKRFSATPEASLALHYGVPTPTVVHGLHFTAELGPVHHHQFRALGGPVPAIDEGSSALIGVVIGYADDARRAIERIVLDTAQGPQAPYYRIDHEPA